MTATRGTRIALLVAVLWSAAILVAGLVVPFYSEQVSVGDGPRSTISSSTLVEENGWPILIVLAMPLVASVVVAAALLRPYSGGGATLLAWVVVAVLGAFNLLALLTVGLFFVPVTIALVVACTLHMSRGPQIR